MLMWTQTFCFWFPCFGYSIPALRRDGALVLYSIDIYIYPNKLQTVQKRGKERWSTGFYTKYICIQIRYELQDGERSAINKRKKNTRESRGGVELAVMGSWRNTSRKERQRTFHGVNLKNRPGRLKDMCDAECKMCRQIARS